VADGDLYGAWGGGGGIGGDDHVGRVNLGYMRVTAVPSPLHILSYRGQYPPGDCHLALKCPRTSVARSAAWWPSSLSSTRRVAL
jgi:hypothetical protein